MKAKKSIYSTVFVKTIVGISKQDIADSLEMLYDRKVKPSDITDEMFIKHVDALQEVYSDFEPSDHELTLNSLGSIAEDLGIANNDADDDE